MREKYAIYTYFIAAIIAYVFLCCDLKLFSSIARVFGVVVLMHAFYVNSKWRSPLFYISIFFSTILEVMIIYDAEDDKYPFMVITFVYYWLIFFLIKKNIKAPSNKAVSRGSIPVIVTVLFVLYLVISVFVIIFKDIKNEYVFPVINTIVFLTVVFYMGYQYIAKKTIRNFWLLLTMISFIINFIVVILEAMVVSSIFLLGLIFIFEVASHYFIYNFLLTPENELAEGGEDNYL